MSEGEDLDRILKPTREYPTDPVVFENLARDVLGQDWIARLARAVGVNIRTAQRWAAAGRVISPAAWEWLYAQEAALKASRFRERLGEAADLADYHGVSTNAVVGLLRDLADEIVASERAQPKK